MMTTLTMLRWEFVGPSTRPRSVAAQWFADGQSGRYTVKRDKWAREWSASWATRDVSGGTVGFSRGGFRNREAATEWCAIAERDGYDAAMSLRLPTS